jgi:hypothetical protein
MIGSSHKAIIELLLEFGADPAMVGSAGSVFEILDLERDACLKPYFCMLSTNLFDLIVFRR